VARGESILLSDCGNIARAHHRDRFIATLMVPLAFRENLWALIALDHEIARTRRVVSDPQLGLIRLQWWQDALAQTAAGLKPPHPVLVALAPVLIQDAAILPMFLRLIEGRMLDLETESFADVAALVDYIDRVHQPFLDLWYYFCGGNGPQARCAEIARVLGMIDVLYGLPGWFQDGRCPLPKDLLQKADAHIARVMDFPKHPAVAAGVAALLVIIKQNARVALKGIRWQSQPVRYAALPLIARWGIVKNIRRAGFQPFVGPDQWSAPDTGMAMRVMLAGINITWPSP